MSEKSMYVYASVLPLFVNVPACLDCCLLDLPSAFGHCYSQVQSIYASQLALLMPKVLVCWHRSVIGLGSGVRQSHASCRSGVSMVGKRHIHSAC